MMSFNVFKQNSNRVIKPSTRVYRKQIIEGFSIPAIIHNDHYFFADLSVYEDGRVECWNFEDFEHFKNDVQRGWVAVSIPDNKDISIHGLGSWTIENGNWYFTKDTFIGYVMEVIKQLNPKLENIYKHAEKKVNGVVVGESGTGTIYKAEQTAKYDIFKAKIDGTSTDLFYKLNNAFYLVQVKVFADDSLELARLETPLILNMAELEKNVTDGVLLTDIPEGATVYIYGLGHFTVKKRLFASSIHDKLSEIKDIQRQLKGEPTTLDICKNAYQDYVEEPTKSNKDKLRIAYEQVPNHQKRFVGDMDTKDFAVRMIIYGEQEIEKWSHYQLAKTRGEKLPTITLPKPKDG